MCSFQIILENLFEYLTGNREYQGNVIRRHTKKLEELGDLSFPLKIQNWQGFVQVKQEYVTIFDYAGATTDLDNQICLLVNESKKWCFHIQSGKIIKDDMHLYLERNLVFKHCIKEVLNAREKYGTNNDCFKTRIVTVPDICDKSTEMCLSELRLLLLSQVLSNMISHLSLNNNSKGEECKIVLTLNSFLKNKNSIVCGSIVNKNGQKDTKTTSSELYRQRSIDMQLMAQHKYGIQMKSIKKDYFSRLGKAAVVMEFLQNKPHKNLKILLNDVQTSNKGPAFILYNCARLTALFKEFNIRVEKKMYSQLPNIEEVDFNLLKQPEEWELIYGYIFQFPLMLISCIGSIEMGTANPQNLITFLSNLSSIFSIYYRRIKILVNPKEPLFGVLHARMYFLKALQEVFHISLSLLNIEPVTEM